MKYYKTQLPLYVLKHHKPVRVKNLFEWANWFEKKRQVKQNKNKKKLVSTIFEGMGDMGSGDVPWFKTAIIDKKDFSIIKEVKTETWDEAMAAHKKMVEEYL